MSLSVLDLLDVTWRSLRGSPLRSGLTSLGVFMGVAAVSATLQVSTISRAVIQQQLSEREAPQIRVFSGWNPITYQSTELKMEDMQYLSHRLGGVQAMSGNAWTPGGSVFFEGKETKAEVLAVSQEFLKTSGRKMIAGKFFSGSHFNKYQPVVVIDETVAEALFKNINPLNKRVYIDRRPYVVIGVVESLALASWDEGKGAAYMPISLHFALTGSREVNTISMRPKRAEEMEALETRTVELLQKQYPGNEFWAWNNVSDIMEQKAMLATVSRALLVLGTISLLVGGVGIANITIASVMERTPEIGLRLAVGATPRDVLCQFVLEAALLSVLGGALAIATVHGATLVVASSFELPYEFDPQAASLAMGSALAVGVGASFVPALQASKLDPVKALRSQ